MGRKIHISLIILIIGFFLLPMLTYACEAKSEKTCCKKEISAEKKNKDCCQKSSQSGDKEEGCGGKCGHSNCTTSTVLLSLIPSDVMEFKTVLFDLATQKQKNHHNETDISSGFYFVWLPPKIN